MRLKKHEIAHEISKKVILIVEDDFALRKMLQARFKFLGFQVLAAADGEEGLKLILERRPHLIILDWTLPKLSGLEICKEIRENIHSSLRDVPIIMLTGKTDDVDRVLGKVVGANSYLTKPYDERVLLKKVSELVS